MTILHLISTYARRLHHIKLLRTGRIQYLRQDHPISLLLMLHCHHLHRRHILLKCSLLTRYFRLFHLCSKRKCKSRMLCNINHRLLFLTLIRQCNRLFRMLIPTVKFLCQGYTLLPPLLSLTEENLINLLCFRTEVIRAGAHFFDLLSYVHYCTTISSLLQCSIVFTILLKQSHATLIISFIRQRYNTR